MHNYFIRCGRWEFFLVFLRVRIYIPLPFISRTANYFRRGLMRPVSNLENVSLFKKSHELVPFGRRTTFLLTVHTLAAGWIKSPDKICKIFHLIPIWKNGQKKETSADLQKIDIFSSIIPIAFLLSAPKTNDKVMRKIVTMIIVIFCRFLKK